MFYLSNAPRLGFSRAGLVTRTRLPPPHDHIVCETLEHTSYWDRQERRIRPPVSRRQIRCFEWDEP